MILITKILIQDIYYKRNLYRLSKIYLSRLCNKYDGWINNIETNRIKYISDKDLLLLYKNLTYNMQEKEIIDYLRNLLNSKEIFKTNKEICREKMKYSYQMFLQKLDEIDENDVVMMNKLRKTFDVQMLSILKELIKERY